MINWLWSKVWRNYLEPGDKIIKVKGWRTALVQNGGRRLTITPCPIMSYRAVKARKQEGEYEQ